MSWRERKREENANSCSGKEKSSGGIKKVSLRLALHGSYYSHSSSFFFFLLSPGARDRFFSYGWDGIYVRHSRGIGAGILLPRRGFLTLNSDFSFRLTPEQDAGPIYFFFGHVPILSPPSSPTHARSVPKVRGGRRVHVEHNISLPSGVTRTRTRPFFRGGGEDP